MALPPHQQPPIEAGKLAIVPAPASKPPIVLVETAFLASTTSLLYLLTYYVPLGPILRIFFPIPIALIYLRWGNRAGWMTALVSGLLLSVFLGPIRSILFLIPHGLLGVQLGACWRRRVGWAISISLGSLLDCLGLFFYFWLMSILVGEDLWMLTIARIRDLAEWIFVQLGIMAEPSLLVIQLLAIGLILLRSVVDVFVVHLVAVLMFERLGNPISKAPRWVEVFLDL